MIKKVLVPLDGSSLAHMALDFATRIVDANCEIILLTSIQKPEIPVYATNPMIFIEPDAATMEALRKDAQQYLEDAAETLKAQGFQPTIRIEVGEPAYSIVHVANSLNVDMIIMSTHGRSGVSRWLFGSVTGRVMSMTPRPVLVVPSQEHQQKFERELAEMNFG
jgi:nucleotide-binding universal stress UspA family protein